MCVFHGNRLGNDLLWEVKCLLNDKCPLALTGLWSRRSGFTLKRLSLDRQLGSNPHLSWGFLLEP